MEAKDIELGGEPIDVERRPRSGVVISVRLSPNEADQLQTIAEGRRQTISQVARDAIHLYLAGGTSRDAAIPPWMATISGQGNLEVIYHTFSGGVAQTEGSASEPEDEVEVHAV